MSTTPTPIVEVKGAIEQIGRNFEEFKNTAEKARKDGDVLLEEKLQKLSNDITAKHEAVQNQLREIEAKSTRPNYSGENRDKVRTAAEEFSKARAIVQRESGQFGGQFATSEDEYSAYTKAFNRYLRYDKDVLTPEEHKSMSVGSDPDGGRWIMPAEMASGVIERSFEGSPIRAIASVQAIGTAEYEVPEDPSDIGAGWVSETGARTSSTTSQPSLKRITAHEMYAFPQVTNKLLQDSAVNIEAYLTGKMGDKFGRLEGTAFVAGTGVGQPRGFTTYASGTTWGTIQQVTTGTSGSFTYSGLVNLITSIKDKYQRNASFVIKRESVAALMTIVDGSSRLIFQPLLNGDFNKTPLLGYQINYATDMASVGAGALALAFGDFKAGYQIVDRLGISVLRDPYSNKPYIGYYTIKRVGGDVIDFDAIKLQVLT